jgi:class 3 adenylate cyclase/HAMP domain-containing protein
MAARRLTATLVASIEGAMLQERPDVTRTVLQELKTSTPVEGLAIFRRNGVEAFTDLATAMEVDKNAGLPREVFDNIRRMARDPGQTASGPQFARAVESLQTQESLETRGSATVFTLYHPILNQEKCQGCHGGDHKVRAVVRVDTSMAPVLAEVRRHRDRQLLIGGLTIVVAAGVLTVAMGRVVVRPLTQLGEVARRVGAGDFDARAPVASGDEIGRLGAAFNEMTARLATARQELEGKNTELATALQHLRESRERLALLEQLKGELSKFVPEAVQRLLDQNPNATELEKRTVEMSVLFLDIDGCTRLSEQLEPRRLNQLVQTYFSNFLEIIQRPEALNEEYGGVFPPVQLHMGINSGEALVGATKIGGAAGQRWTFTATGPTTNVAARFAGSAQAGEIVVGPPTAERIKSQFVLESVGERAFKNVSQPIHVYRVIPPGVYEKIE